MDIDKFREILSDLIDELPLEIFENLNGGVVVSEEEKIYEGKDSLYTMGQYIVGQLGSQVVIYYGSFNKLYWYYSEEQLKEKLREVLHHELTHHVEYMAGANDLHLEDLKFLSALDDDNE